jgi:hypothetical protein
MAIPRGSEAELIVRQIGPGQYVLDLESITANGQRYALDTSGPQYHMPQRDYQDGSGIVGAIVGAISGANGERGEGRGAEIRIPPGSQVTFQLQEPMHVVDSGDQRYQRGGYHYHHDDDWYH